MNLCDFYENVCIFEDLFHLKPYYTVNLGILLVNFIKFKHIIHYFEKKIL